MDVDSDSKAGGAPVTREFRIPRATRIFSCAVTVLLGVLTMMMVVLAALILRFQVGGLGLLMVAVSVAMAAMFEYCWRDYRAKAGLRIVLRDRDACFDLPANRSLIHRPPALHLVVPYREIEAIVTRLEAYSAQGMGMMQRAYALRRRHGDLIFLFEERALATTIATQFFAGIVAELATRAHCAVEDLGMVEGKGGVFGAWGAQTPSWTTPTLPLYRQKALWARAASIGTFISLAYSLVWLVMVAAGI